MQSGAGWDCSRRACQLRPACSRKIGAALGASPMLLSGYIAIQLLWCLITCCTQWRCSALGAALLSVILHCCMQGALVVLVCKIVDAIL